MAVKCPDVFPKTAVLEDAFVSPADQTLEVGASVTWRCQAGYEIVGEAVRRCLSSGQWSDGLPSCIAESDASEGLTETEVIIIAVCATLGGVALITLVSLACVVCVRRNKRQRELQNSYREFTDAGSRRPMYPESPMSPMSPDGYYPTARSNPIFQGMPGEVDAVRHPRMPHSPPLTSASVDAWERHTEPRGFTRDRRYEARHGFDDAISHVSDSQWTNNKIAWHDFYNYDLNRHVFDASLYLHKLQVSDPKGSPGNTA